MTLDTQMTLALLQELLLSLRANDPDNFKGWLAEGVHELGEPTVIELMLDGLTQSSPLTKPTDWWAGTLG